jgi:hypothetical protein
MLIQNVLTLFANYKELNVKFLEKFAAEMILKK